MRSLQGNLKTTRTGGQSFVGALVAAHAGEAVVVLVLIRGSIRSDETKSREAEVGVRCDRGHRHLRAGCWTQAVLTIVQSMPYIQVQHNSIVGKQ